MQQFKASLGNLHPALERKGNWVWVSGIILLHAGEEAWVQSPAGKQIGFFREEDDSGECV